MNINKASIKSTLKDESDAETFFKKQIFEIDEEKFITPDLNGDDWRSC